MLRFSSKLIQVWLRFHGIFQTCLKSGIYPRFKILLLLPRIRVFSQPRESSQNEAFKKEGHHWRCFSGGNCLGHVELFQGLSPCKISRFVDLFPYLTFRELKNLIYSTTLWEKSRNLLKESIVFQIFIGPHLELPMVIAFLSFPLFVCLLFVYFFLFSQSFHSIDTLCVSVSVYLLV